MMGTGWGDKTKRVKHGEWVVTVNIAEEQLHDKCPDFRIVDSFLRIKDSEVQDK